MLIEIGPVDIDVPRDRDGTFEPRIVKKRQRRLDGVDQLVLSAELLRPTVVTSEVSGMGPYATLGMLGATAVVVLAMIAFVVRFDPRRRVERIRAEARIRLGAAALVREAEEARHGTPSAR